MLRGKFRVERQGEVAVPWYATIFLRPRELGAQRKGQTLKCRVERVKKVEVPQPVANAQLSANMKPARGSPVEGKVVVYIDNGVPIGGFQSASEKRFT